MTPDPISGGPKTPPAAPERAWHGPRGELLVAIQFALLFAFVLAPPWNPWVSPALLDATGAARLGVLVICVLIALGLGAFGSLHIRRYLTPLPYPVDHSRLVTGGVYRMVRHPLYSSQLFAALGWTCYMLSLSHLALLVIGFLFFDSKARLEEGWLTERHPEYTAYAAKVKKFVPWVY